MKTSNIERIRMDIRLRKKLNKLWLVEKLKTAIKKQDFLGRIFEEWCKK